MATDDEIMYAHDREYVERVRELGHAPRFANPTLDFGLGSADNPVFPDMHEASALVTGGSLVAAELVMSGQATHAFNPGGGLHHANRRLASGFCVYNDCAVAIAWLRMQGLTRPLHRHRCPPRRRRPGDLLRGPRRPDDLVPRDRALPVPRHRLHLRARQRRRLRLRRQRAAACRTPITPRSWSATSWSCRRWRGRSSRTSSWRRTAATATPSTR